MDFRWVLRHERDCSLLIRMWQPVEVNCFAHHLQTFPSNLCTEFSLDKQIFFYRYFCDWVTFVSWNFFGESWRFFLSDNWQKTVSDMVLKDFLATFCKEPVLLVFFLIRSVNQAAPGIVVRNKLCGEENEKKYVLFTRFCYLSFTKVIFYTIMCKGFLKLVRAVQVHTH